jgi:hypothetical protein
LVVWEEEGKREWEWWVCRGMKISVGPMVGYGEMENKVRM